MAERSPGESDGHSWGEDRQIVYSTSSDRDSSVDLSVAVVEALAEARERTPIEIDRPLYDVVDPDALNQLFTDGSADVSGRVVFEFGDHEVTVHSDGDILVRRIR